MTGVIVLGDLVAESGQGHKVAEIEGGHTVKGVDILGGVVGGAIGILIEDLALELLALVGIEKGPGLVGIEGGRLFVGFIEEIVVGIIPDESGHEEIVIAFPAVFPDILLAVLVLQRHLGAEFEGAGIDAEHVGNLDVELAVDVLVGGEVVVPFEFIEGEMAGIVLVAGAQVGRPFRSVWIGEVEFHVGVLVHFESGLDVFGFILGRVAVGEAVVEFDRVQLMFAAGGDIVDGLVLVTIAETGFELALRDGSGGLILAILGQEQQSAAAFAVVVAAEEAAQEELVTGFEEIVGGTGEGQAVADEGVIAHLHVLERKIGLGAVREIGAAPLHLVIVRAALAALEAGTDHEADVLGLAEMAAVGDAALEDRLAAQIVVAGAGGEAEDAAGIVKGALGAQVD